MAHCSNRRQKAKTIASRVKQTSKQSPSQRAVKKNISYVIFRCVQVQFGRGFLARQRTKRKQLPFSKPCFSWCSCELAWALGTTDLLPFPHSLYENPLRPPVQPVLTGLNSLKTANLKGCEPNWNLSFTKY